MQHSFFSSEIGTGGKVGYRQIVAVFVGTAILSLSAYITVPMWPVPLTLETLAVVLIGAFYGWRLGGVTIVAWLLEGLAGLPVLAGGTGGLLHFMGPTGGYLLSYPLMGVLMGWLVARGWDGSRPLLAFCAAVLSSALCLAVGAAWLAVSIGPTAAFVGGVAPFVIGEILKAALAAVTLAIYASSRQRRARGG